MTQGYFKFLSFSTLSSVLLAALVPATSALASPPAPWYSITGINAGLNVTDAISTTTTGINSAGDVVGSIELPKGERLAYVWRDGNQNGKVDPSEIRLLPSTLGGKGSGAEAINDLGQIVGYAMRGGNSRAALWDGSTAQWIDLGTLGGYTSRATDINNRGVIVGTAKNSSGHDTAFIGQLGQPMTGAKCSDSNYPASRVNAINDFGAWIGSCIRQQGLIEIFLGNIFGSSLSGTNYVDINNPGLIIGNALLKSGRQGFVFDSTNPSGQPIPLNQPSVDPATSAKKPTEANAINDHGAIVGSAGTFTRTSATDGTYRPDYAALWTDHSATITNLNDRINKACNWDLKEATDINKNGQIIGNGLHNNISQGFRLTSYTGFALNGEALAINEGEDALVNLLASAPGDCTPLDKGNITYTITLPSNSPFQISGGKTLSQSLSGLTDKQVNLVKVMATDAQGFTRHWEQTVTVKNVAPTITSITPDLVVQVGELFGFNMTAIDPGINDRLSYQWSSPDDPSFSSTAASGQRNFTTPGIYQLLATVMDDDGGKSTPRSMNVTVTDAPAAAVPEPTTVGGVLLAGAIGSQLRRRASQRKNKRPFV